MTDPGEDFAASLRPTLDGRDVMRVALAVVGLTIATFVFLDLLYSLLLIAGIGESLTISAPLLFLVETVTALTALYLVLIKFRGFTWRELGWEPASTGWLVMGGAAALAMYGVLVSLVLIVSRFRGGAGVDLIPAPSSLFPISVLGFLGSLAFGAVTVPIAEEFLFRGVLYRWLRGRWGLYAGIIGSALVFALVHLVLGSGAAPQIFLMGLALAYLYEHTGSLLPSMVFHGVNNGINFVWIYFVLWFGAS